MMKKFYLSTLIVTLINIAGFSQSNKPRSLKPTNFQKRVTTIVSEKTRYYYSLNDKEASVIRLTGPGTLRVITRGRFVPGEDEKIKYEIVYSIDGGKSESVRKSSVERSKKATFKNNTLGVPGQLEDFEIELGRGSHSIEFKLADKKYAVAARYIFTKKKVKKQEWIGYSPLQPSEPVDLISRESTIGYYRFSLENPLKVEINGPTELRLLTRIENHFQMKGRIHYRVQVSENGKVLNTYQLSSRRSEIAVYKDDNELIPGKACEFVINVPRGRHIYQIVPLDKDKNTILGRFLIPKKDIKIVD